MAMVRFGFVAPCSTSIALRFGLLESAGQLEVMYYTHVERTKPVEDSTTATCLRALTLST